MNATVRFYFDYESPNAYLAWTQLPQLAEKYGAVIEAVPILYAALLEAHGQLGPGEIPVKGRWMTKNVLARLLPVFSSHAAGASAYSKIFRNESGNFVKASW